MKCTQSYSEFYSKPELINLCGELIKFDYNGFNHSLKTILIMLNSRAIRTVYYYGQNVYGDLDSVVVEYLRGQGNLVVYYYQITVQFRDGGRIFSSLSAVEAIVRSSGFDFVSVDQVVQHHIPNIVVDLNKIPVPVINIVSEIENRSFTVIKIAHLGASYKVLLQFSNISYLNFDHFSFQELMRNFKNMNSDHIEMYLLGLLGTGLSLSPVVISEP